MVASERRVFAKHMPRRRRESVRFSHATSRPNRLTCVRLAHAGVRELRRRSLRRRVARGPRFAFLPPDMAHPIKSPRPLRFAVVGQGYFSQMAVLPAFTHVDSAELVALVSDDPLKLQELGEKYHVTTRATYAEYDRLLESNVIDAVYIALPNDMHASFTVRAARAGKHVLCEKPMALTEADCVRMITACEAANVKLMIAYRLHFEEANLSAVDRLVDGEVGQPRIFSSVFSMQVREGNTRLSARRGGGPLHDIGIYCINAARYLFRDEPIEVLALTGRAHDDPRFSEVDESVSAILRFPGDRIATFVASFGAADVARYEVVGTEGALVVESAYDFAANIQHRVTRAGKTKTKTFARRDQVAAELTYFARCVFTNEEPEPSGFEGLADVRLMRAISRSAELRQAVKVEPLPPKRRPNLEQEIHVRPHVAPRLVHAQPPSR
jgi:glucose-fructose oxidoreductase